MTECEITLDTFTNSLTGRHRPQNLLLIGTQTFATKLIALFFQVSNTAFAAVTLSALYQVAADDGLCNSPYFLQRHPMRTQAYDKV